MDSYFILFFCRALQCNPNITVKTSLTTEQEMTCSLCDEYKCLSVQNRSNKDPTVAVNCEDSGIFHLAISCFSFLSGRAAPNKQQVSSILLMRTWVQDNVFLAKSLLVNKALTYLYLVFESLILRATTLGVLLTILMIHFIFNQMKQRSL